MSNTKLTGKEMATLNKRKRFYSKLERLINNLKSDEEKITISLNKKTSFPEFDDLSIHFDKKSYTEDKEDVITDLKELQVIDLPTLDEARFLSNIQKKGLIELIRRESEVNNDNVTRKGLSSSEEDNYNYQQAYVWSFLVKDKEKLTSTLEKEKEEPTFYEVEEKTKNMPKMKYKKSYKQFRARRKKN